MTSIGTGKMPGSDAPFRRELEASIPADLSAVLAFYRSELGKRGWKESTEARLVKPDQVQLAFAASDGPAHAETRPQQWRDLGQPGAEISGRGRQGQRHAEAGPGQAGVRQYGRQRGHLTINKQTIKIAAGAGGPQSPDRPMLELPPGKYQYSVKLAGRPAKNNTVEVTADDAWGLMIAPSGEVLALQIY